MLVIATRNTFSLHFVSILRSCKTGPATGMQQITGEDEEWKEWETERERERERDDEKNTK